MVAKLCPGSNAPDASLTSVLARFHGLGGQTLYVQFATDALRPTLHWHLKRGISQLHHGKWKR